MLQATLERHPSFSEQLAIPEPRGRKFRRRLFYVLTAGALVAAGVTQRELMIMKREREEHEERSRREGVQRALHTFRSALNETAQVQGQLLGTAMRKMHLAETVLITINIVIAVRGLQVWSLISKTGVEGWVHKISMQWPIYERATRVLKFTSAPVRVPLNMIKSRRLARVLAKEQLALAQAERMAREASWAQQLYHAARFERLETAKRVAVLPWRWLGLVREPLPPASL